MPAQWTQTARRQGYRNAITALAVLLVACCLAAAAMALIFSQPFARSFGISLEVLCFLAILAFLAQLLYGLGARGGVLLDCGPHPRRVMFLVNGVLFLAIGLLELLGGVGATSWFGVGIPVILVSWAFCTFILASGHLQLRENGIWEYWILLRWRSIESYEWASDSTLFVRRRGFLSFSGRGALPVPPEQKQALETLLEKHGTTSSSA